jgi:hypothetical protein
MVIAFLIAMGLKPIAKYRYVLSLLLTSLTLLTTLPLLTYLIFLTSTSPPDSSDHLRRGYF